MKLHQIRDALNAEVRARRSQMYFEEAKRHQPALRPYETVVGLLGALDAMSDLAYADKDALIRVLLRENKRRPHSLWNAVLFLVFYPMLLRLRGRIRGDAEPGDELDQIVLFSFLELVAEFPLGKYPDRICMRLRQTTGRAVFARVRARQKELDEVRIYDHAVVKRMLEDINSLAFLTGWVEDEPRSDQCLSDATAEGDLVSFLVTHAGDALDGDKLELVVATKIRGERLSAHVDRVHPGLPEVDRRRAYQRIKRRHSRAVARLRVALADVWAEVRVPDRSPVGFSQL